MVLSARFKKVICLVSLLVVLFSSAAGCAGQIQSLPTSAASETPKVFANPTATQEPPLPTPSPAPTATQTPPGPLRVWLPNYLPNAFRQALDLGSSILPAQTQAAANLRIEIQPPNQQPNSHSTAWVYALAAPFPTVIDEISLSDLKMTWRGPQTSLPGKGRLLVDPETLALFRAWWGAEDPNQVQVVAAQDLLDSAWNSRSGWAILPFEMIEPRWKVIRVDGQSPLDPSVDLFRYPLAIHFGFTGEESALSRLPENLALPTNRDPEKLTVLVMTGVTALARHIGEVMENKGVNYPAQDIGSWLASADLTHISNEVSFYADCPKPGPERADMRFCSNPKYIELLETVGTDIVELTGNHNLDWGIPPYLDTLRMYSERGWGVYGGGANLADARQPLLVEHNGNKLAFLGCSPAGPEKVWADDQKPGSAPCNMYRLEQQIKDLAAEGYLPVVTFQAVESDTYQPAPAQGAPDFRRMAKSGAMIVSGSQSHVPQTMTFVQNGFIHYGLGNLFFDQMTPPRARQAFIDRHFFYNGKYLGVELMTTLLEEYARPRPMTAPEREAFLTEIFSLCVWGTDE